jgi:hypothetical protein
VVGGVRRGRGEGKGLGMGGGVIAFWEMGRGVGWGVWGIGFRSFLDFGFCFLVVRERW